MDAVADVVAEKMGYHKLPWLRVTWILLWAYTCLTCLVMIYRSDFINLTVCVTALYMLFNTHTLTRTRFRVLVLGIFISIVVDIFWFIIKWREFSKDDKEDAMN